MIPFIILGIIFQYHAFRLPQLTDTIYIVYIIICVALQIIMVCNCDIIKDEQVINNFTNFFVKPIVIDIVFLGIVMPFLFAIPLLFKWFTFSIFYLNGGIIIASILQIFLTYYKSERRNEGTISILLTFLICIFHALITAFTASILIPIILRFIYGILLWKHKKKEY